MLEQEKAKLSLISGRGTYVELVALDALLGLRELFEDHPEIIGLSLTSLLNGCVRLIADEVAKPV